MNDYEHRTRVILVSSLIGLTVAMLIAIYVRQP